jgi:sugar phosphate isomerase/epimerase
MTDRRSFMTTLAAGVGASAMSRPWLLAAEEAGIADKLGLQLYSLREYLPKDPAGTLAKVRELGIVEVETYGVQGLTAAQLRAEMDTAGLSCQASHMGLDLLEKDPEGAIAQAKTLGAHWVVCPWVLRKPPFDRDAALHAADVFEKTEALAAKEGMKVVYHCHGYEFLPSDEGTLFDTLAKAAPNIHFEIDVYWAQAGGADPRALIAAYPGRVPLLHVKDMQKGLELPRGSSGAPHETQVVVGTGQMDWPGILGAAEAGGGKLYYLEDESPSVWEQLPGSLKYLRGLKL